MSAQSEVDAVEAGLGYLRLLTAIGKADKILSRISLDHDIDMFVRSEVRSALLLLREATE